MESFAQEAIDALYKEGKLVKALDESGTPKLRGGKQVYKDFGYATEAELAFFKKEETQAGRPKRYTLEELKAMGAPFRQARIFVSLKKRKAKISFRIAGNETMSTTVEILIGNTLTASEIGEEMAGQAWAGGLITEGTEYEIFDCDAPELQPVPTPESEEMRELRAKAAKIWPSLRNRRAHDR
jgi:hypothetical protein